MWCSVAMVKNYTFMIDQFWPFFFDRCIQFVQLPTVDIRTNRLVLGSSSKNNAPFQFSFRYCLWWFITLGPRSFSNDVIINNLFFITSDDSFQKKIEFIAFKMQITSFDAFCQINFFQFTLNPNIKFFNEF